MGGYGILASLDRETAGGAVRDAGQRDGHGARHALVAGAGLVALLAWWWCSNSTPAVTLAPKAVWQAPVARPAVAPVAPAAHDEPALIVNDAPAATLAKPAPAAAAAVIARPVTVAVSARRDRAAPHPPAKAARREVVHATPAPKVQAALMPPDHDVSLLTALVAHQNGIAQPSRDVVEPHLADSTAALLQRCGRVGGEEGRLCRVRICTGRQMDVACAGD
ncbi:hypothetical protein C9I28_21015 [Pseudoduganella armeniaca]|uniref:Uncharacterized protein n=1 Tax=Pseudoduganella armeniaca TaxID=2072590 RepID=A0A2R4CDY6_9BURK|nr:hypothetical protein C9I28_21015 [Pseudoduganella armeniaca]